MQFKEIYFQSTLPSEECDMYLCNIVEVTMS